MDVARAFVALESPAEIQQALRQVSADLKLKLRGLPLRWVAIENIHLTLKFLGNITPVNIKAISDLMLAKTQSIPSFDIELNGLGVFPSPRRPNVVWVGVEVTEALLELQQQLELDLSSLGYPPEKRPFSAHLTLARVRRAAHPAELQRIGEIVASARVVAPAAGRIEAVTLYRSELKPGGSVYNALFRSTLSSSV